MASNNGLMIAALVAIVAVVGLVILFSSGNSTGALVCGQIVQEIGTGQYARMCYPGNAPAVSAINNPDLTDEGVVWYTGQQEPSMMQTTAMYKPFNTVQQADARRLAIASGGFEAVQR